MGPRTCLLAHLLHYWPRRVTTSQMSKSQPKRLPLFLQPRSRDLLNQLDNHPHHLRHLRHLHNISTLTARFSPRYFDCSTSFTYQTTRKSRGRVSEGCLRRGTSWLSWVKRRPRLVLSSMCPPRSLTSQAQRFLQLRRRSKYDQPLLLIDETDCEFQPLEGLALRQLIVSGLSEIIAKKSAFPNGLYLILYDPQGIYAFFAESVPTFDSVLADYLPKPMPKAIPPTTSSPSIRPGYFDGLF
jgi:hypothetical protein